MFSKHVARHLSAYCHGELTMNERRDVEAHLRECSKCRAALEEIRSGIRFASTLSSVPAPDSIWSGLRKERRTRPQFVWTLSVGVVTSVALAALFFVFTRGRGPSDSGWEVTGLPGVLSLRPGEVLQTNSSSEARVRIANIGQLTMDPNTRIRLLVTQSDQHRIALDRGKLEATTWAPPRLFIVETPSATAVDLGCKYTLEVQEDGSSLLHVTLGMVALERDNRETIVPAGAFCRTREGTGPGTPFFEDSSTRFQSALQRLDAGVEGRERMRQLEIVLSESHVRDALSLWHLLPRLDAESRGLIYDRLAQLLPPPTDVTREGIVALDRKMLNSWKQIVSQLWQ
jgi:predicted anti-sigma-YlaC factor YlaD